MAKRYEYTITLTTAQAREVQKALEAIMRWILKQPEIMREYLPDRLCWNHGENFDISLAKRKAATDLLKVANDLLCPYSYANGDAPLKTDQWHRIYGIYQVIRHAIWEAESDDKSKWSVDSWTPYPSGNEELPKIEWREVDG